MKGQAEVVLVGVAGIIIVIGFFLNVFIGSQMNLKEVAKETDVVKAINTMESVKKGLPYGVYYSYLEALNRGGYSSFSQVENSNSDKFKSNISLIFSEYENEIESKSDIVIPFGTINLSSTGDDVIVSFYSPSLLTYKYSSPEFSFNISDNPNVTIEIINNQLLE